MIPNKRKKVACILQGMFGHRYSLMEGQSGLWWGVILSLAAIASALNVDLGTIGGSIAVGAMISGFLVAIFVGMTIMNIPVEAFVTIPELVPLSFQMSY